MTKTLLLLAIATLAALAVPGSAQACAMRLEFHRQSSGSLAYLRDATDLGQAHRVHSNWCSASRTPTHRLSPSRGRLIFAVNNRRGRGGERGHMVIRILRHAREVNRPAIMGSLEGEWSNRFCGRAVSRIEISNIKDFFEAARWPTDQDSRRSQPCSPLHGWLGEAWRDPRLSLAATPLRGYLTNRQGVGNGWTSEIRARAIQTISTSRRGDPFQMFEVERLEADKIVVEVLALGVTQRITFEYTG